MTSPFLSFVMSDQTLKKQGVTLLNKTSDAEKLSDFLASYIKTFEIPDETHNDLRLATEEIFINIVSYAHTNGELQPVTIEFNHTNKNISITFTDTGIEFNPLTDPRKYNDTEDHCEGGMGICLITSLTDLQEYNRVGQSNVFTVTKHYTR